MIRYRDNMTKAEEAAMMAEIEKEDAIWAEVARQEAVTAVYDDAADDEEMEEANQMETLRRAALSRGQP